MSEFGPQADGGRFADPADPWSISETDVAQARLPQAEALFSIGNGFIGIRGCHEEAIVASGQRTEPAVYLNGVYEVFPIRYHESAYGFPSSSDTRVPAPDGTALEIRSGGERFSLTEARVIEYRRRLDLRGGMLTRRVLLEWPSGRSIEARFERLALFEHPNLVALRVRLRPVNFSDSIEVSSWLRTGAGSPAPDRDEEIMDPRIGPRFEHDPWREPAAFRTGRIDGFVQQTRLSGIRVCAAVTHEVEGAASAESTASAAGICRRLNFRASVGETITLVKFLAYATDRGLADRTPRDQAVAALECARERGFEALVTEQRRYLDRFWERALVELSGAPVLETATRLGLFQLLQATGRDGETSVSAKGQTGEGYEGHVFWDAESFVLPFFVFTDPDIARAMLVYRYRGLEGAREHARTMGHRRGALFPWRTIGGRECSSYFPAGSAQYHISADIARAVALYLEVTGDDGFLAEFGAEILVETARLWLEVGYFDPRRGGQFCINRVTGPDEYSALVDNNFYTNAMARENLRAALAALERLAERRPADDARLRARLDVSEDETNAWRAAADATYLPYCERERIFLQDDAFLTKEVWDFEHTPPERYPLLLHFHPLTIYRHQVCKQADVVLAMFLFGHLFDPGDVARTYDYYRAVTVHDSTLSPGVFAIVAGRIGRTREAHDFFRRTALIDLENSSRNSDHGLHMAAMASAWMAIAGGFGGLRAGDGELQFAPIACDEIGPYRFRIGYRGRRIEVAVDRDRVVYRLLEGEPIELSHHGRRCRLESQLVQDAA